MNQFFDIVCCKTDNPRCVVAVLDSRELAQITGKRAIIVTTIRDPIDAKRLRLTADFIIYEVTSRTTEKELRRIVDNHLCDMICGVEQININPGLHNQKILFNHIIAAICAEKHIDIILNLRPILFDNFSRIAAQRIRFIAELCKKEHTLVVAATFAKKIDEIRNPSDLTSVIQTIVQPLIKL